MDINPEAGSRNYSVVVVSLEHCSPSEINIDYSISNNLVKGNDWEYNMRIIVILRCLWRTKCGQNVSTFVDLHRPFYWQKIRKNVWQPISMLSQESDIHSYSPKLLHFTREYISKPYYLSEQTPIKSKENGVSTNTPLDLTNDCWYLLTKQPFLKMVISYPENC